MGCALADSTKLPGQHALAPSSRMACRPLGSVSRPSDCSALFLPARRANINYFASSDPQPGTVICELVLKCVLTLFLASVLTYTLAYALTCILASRKACKLTCVLARPLTSTWTVLDIQFGMWTGICSDMYSDT